MTADVALAEARKITKTTKAKRECWLPPLELTLAEWEQAVTDCAAKIMAGEKVKKLDQRFDAPQYANQIVELARKTGWCRDLRITAKCAITSIEGLPIVNENTKALKIGWQNYIPGISQVI